MWLGALRNCTIRQYSQLKSFIFVVSLKFCLEPIIVIENFRPLGERGGGGRIGSIFLMGAGDPTIYSQLSSHYGLINLYKVLKKVKAILIPEFIIITTILEKLAIWRG